MYLLDPVYAFDTALWHSRGNCNNAFRDVDNLVQTYGRGCDKCLITIDGRNVVLLYKSIDMLAQRIHQVTGMSISGDFDYTSEVVSVDITVPIDRSAERQSLSSKLEEQKQRRLKRNEEIAAENKRHQEWKQEQMVLANQNRKEFYERVN